MGRNQIRPATRQRRVALPTQVSPPISSPDMPASRPRSSNLLAAKLAVPQQPPGLVVRPRLMDRMAAGSNGRVTLVIAGPGWGKSQLVASWVTAGIVPGPVAWVSLDSHDNDSVVFWSYVLAAVRATGEVEAGSMLSGISLRAPMDDDQFQRIVLGLAALRRSVTLVLDDWDEIRDAQVLSGVAAVLRHDSALHLVLISRSDPRLRLRRLQADGGLTEIRAAELAFTASEAEELLQNADVGLSAAQRQALVERTEGWATGLRLAAQFASRPGYAERIEEFAGDEHTVAEYLVEEVLADMPVAGQRFLLQTSVTERLCGDLADALTQETDGQRQLEALERANAFVVALGPEHRWFRYHPLLAGLLRHRMMLDDPALLPVLHRRAARWYAAQGEALEALRHAAQAGDWQLMGELVVSQASMRAVSAERQALGAILAAIPANEIHTTAELRVCAGLRHFIAGDYTAMANDAAQARAMLSGRDPQSRRAIDVLLRTMDLVLARVAGNMPGMVDAATDLLGWVPDTQTRALPAAAEYEAAALTNRGYALLWLGRTDEAETDLQAGRTVATEAGLELTLINALGSLGLLDLDRGRCRAAAVEAGEALAIAEQRGWTRLTQVVISYLTLAALNVECDDLPEAQRLLEVALSTHRSDPEKVMFYALKAAEARVLVAGGHVGAAQSSVDDCTRELGAWPAPPLLRRWLGVAGVELDLISGDPKSALERTRAISAQLPGTIDPLTMCAARAYLALGELGEAENLLAPMRQRSGNASTSVEAWLLTAFLAQDLTDEPRGLSALNKALTIAEPERIRRPFVTFDRPRLHAMLQHRPQASPDVEAFANDLLARLSDTRKVTSPYVALTGRERTVLSHLAMMQTNDEIAADLFVSINTVKAHAISVYRKLGVANRRAAVLRARDLGLL